MGKINVLDTPEFFQKAVLSNELVATLMNTFDVGMAVVQDMRVKFANQNFLDTLGYSRTEIEKKFIVELIHPDDIDTTIKYYVGLREGTIDSSPPFEFKAIASDGSIIHTEAKVTLIQWEGDVAGLVLFWDAEKQRMLRDRLQDEASRQEEILQGLSDPVIFTDTNLRIAWANKAALEAFSLSPDRIVGLPCHELFQKSQQPCAGCPAPRTVMTGLINEGVVSYTNGRTMRVRSFPVMKDETITTGLTITVVDVTDLKRLEEKPEQIHAPPNSPVPDGSAVLAAPADRNYLYPLSLSIDCPDGRLVCSLQWPEQGRSLTLTRLMKSELSSVRLLYLAARMKSNGEGWVDKDSIRAGKTDYKLYELRKALEQSEIPWLDVMSARMMIRSRGEGSGEVRLAIPPGGLTISPKIVNFRSQKHDLLISTGKKIEKIKQQIARQGEDEYLKREHAIQKQNLKNIKKSIDTIESLFSEALDLLGLSKKI